MIQTLAAQAQNKGTKAFYHTQRKGPTLTLSFKQVRLASAALARRLGQRGYGPGSYVASCMYNCAEFPVLALACAYAGVTLAVLNPRLSDSERAVRLAELEASTNQADIPVFTEQLVKRSLYEALSMSLDELSHASPVPGQVPVSGYVAGVLDFAAQREAAFSPQACGVIMFTSGTSGTPKAARLPWASLMGAASAANAVLMKPGTGVWQLAMPMCHVGGFQIMVRSLLNGSPFVLYERYNPTRILNDVLTFDVTHISVVDKMLRDLLEQDKDRIIPSYDCILLGGAALNEKTTKRSLRAKAKVYASYGSTETCSLVACRKMGRGFDGGLDLLPGYSANIVRPDAKGAGGLNIKGPGVFSGYLNARASFTLDDWFVTGDRARMDRDKRLHLLERTQDVIISGGENIYPAEIREALLAIPGVKDAYVFGTADEEWGYRPVAFLEADYSAEAIAADHAEAGLDPAQTGIRAAMCSQEFAHMVHAFLKGSMSNLQHPKHILVLRAFPRTVADKVDATALRQAYDKRIDVKSISLYRVKQPLAHAVSTAKGTVSERESYFVEVKDWAGRTGIGECVSFATDWYLPETLEQDWQATQTTIANIVMNERYLHPRQVSRSFATFPALAGCPQARSAVECAIWDLFGKICGMSLQQLIGGTKAQVQGGAVVGVCSTEETLAAVARLVEAGYTRVKIKVRPGNAVERVRAVRVRFPELSVFVDANQSFTEANLDELVKLDALGIDCLEEPLDPAYTPASGSRNIFDRLSVLQQSLSAPICLDESIVTAANLRDALAHRSLRCYAVKIAKFGGIQPSLDFIEWATAHGKQVWLGGMFDTGVSKRTYAALQSLPGVSMPGDLSDSSEYFAHDCAYPPLALEHGMLTLNPEGHELGIGCVLDKGYVDSILIDSVTLAK